MLLQRCDECGTLGEPGDTWAEVTVRPYYIPGNRHVAMDEVMPMNYGQTGAVCSPRCAVTRLAKALTDLATFSTAMLEQLSTDQLLEHLNKPKRPE